MKRSNQQTQHFRPQLWKRELLSMWNQWMPQSKSSIWVILALSALCTGLHHSPKIQLQLSPQALASSHLWTPFTTGWVLTPASPLFPMLLLLIIAAFKSGAMNGKANRPRYFGYAGTLFLALSFINLILPHGLIWSLCSEGLLLIWFGQELERRIGPRQMITLSAAILTITYLFAALYLHLFGGAPVNGFTPLGRALILAWGSYHGHAHLSFLNIQARQLRWVVYAFSVFELALSPPPVGLTTLTAALMMDLWVQGRLKGVTSHLRRA